MKKEAPNYLINLIPSVNKPLEQGTIIYQATIVEETASSIIFFLQL